jgi:hypothetical protein
LTANAAVAISGGTARYNPYGIPYTVADANSTIIPANTVQNSIIVGQGNVVSFLDVGGNAEPFSITEMGAPHPNTGTTGVLATPAAGGPTT